MSFAVAALMVLGLAALVVYPLMVSDDGRSVHDSAPDRETFEREKNVALLAIREADLDRAMGKLSEEDYAALRGLYEQRALVALNALDAAKVADASGHQAHVSSIADGDRSDSAAGGGSALAATSRFCAGCGRGFVSDERFCPACGRARAS